MNKITHAALVIVSVTTMAFLAGCSAKPIIQTQVIGRPIPVHCEVKIPEECKESYSVDRVSVKDDPVVINRAFRMELEERSACEVMLRAAVHGCNNK